MNNVSIQTVLKAIKENDLPVIHLLASDPYTLATPVTSDPSGCCFIHLAAQKGRFEIIKILLEKNPALVNQPDKLSQTPILWAARNGHTDVVQYLLSEGADVNATTNHQGFIDHGMTALGWARNHCHSAVVELLVQAGAVDTPGMNGLYLVHEMAEKGNLEKLIVLLEKNPRLLNQPDNLGQTPILWAARNGHTNVVLYLRSKGAGVMVITNHQEFSDHGMTAREWARSDSHSAAVDLIVSAGAVDTPGMNGLYLVHETAKKGDLKTLILLLQKNPHLLNQPDKCGQTPILWAAIEGHANVVQYLLSEGADVNVTTNHQGFSDHGMTALKWAAHQSYNAVVDLLVSAGAVDTPGINGLYLVHETAKKGNLKTLTLLLEKNFALLNQLDAYGQTPILWAARNGHTNVVQHLLSKSADLNAATNREGDADHGKTALSWARSQAHSAIVDLLVQAGAPETQPTNEIPFISSLLTFFGYHQQKPENVTRTTLDKFKSDEQTGQNQTPSLKKPEAVVSNVPVTIFYTESDIKREPCSADADFDWAWLKEWPSSSI